MYYEVIEKPRTFKNMTENTAKLHGFQPKTILDLGERVDFKSIILEGKHFS